MQESVKTVIIGGGQAGLGLSYFLRQAGHEHIVLEKASQPGEAWRRRWDSFTLVTPNWSFRLPGAEYAGDDPDGFMPRSSIVSAFEQYASRFKLPVAFDTCVTAVVPREGGGFVVQTDGSEYLARSVVVATGLYQNDKVPAFAASIPPHIVQLRSSQYRRPQELPPGAVLVVGSGQSGAQIAEELYQSGRTVYLSASAAPRVPRRYRGRDIYYWADATGFIHRTPDKLPSPAARFGPNPLFSGRDGGRTLNLHQFQRDGVVLLGHLAGVQDGKLLFAPDLKETLAKSDQAEAGFIEMIEGYISQNNIAAEPAEPLPHLTDGYQAPEIRSLDLDAEGIGTILWACGYTFDFSLVKSPVTDSFGFPITRRGVTDVPGLYFLGLPWLHRMSSGQLMGFGSDAQYLADMLTANGSQGAV